jgi:hypothetical protein
MNIKIYKNKTFVLLLSIFLSNCLSHYKHSWVNDPDELEMISSELDKITSKEYIDENITIIQYGINIGIISGLYKEKYIEMLKNVQIIEITKEEANNISHNVFNEINKKYFIVRALYTVKGGIYEIGLTENNNLSIYYLVMAKKGYKPNEDALIIELDEKPSNIYIGYINIR